jgi:viroplasmin and RNaseH domain-containing protein
MEKPVVVLISKNEYHGEEYPLNKFKLFNTKEQAQAYVDESNKKGNQRAVVAEEDVWYL